MINITDKHNCCGCTACASICKKKAITMKPDEEGFLYPVGDLSLCNDCHLCEKVCPIIARDSLKTEFVPHKFFALHNKEEDTWQKSSSGGVFTAMIEEFININGIVYGAEYNNNLKVVHNGETTIDKALKFRGSKYVQSDIQGIYEEIRSQLLIGIQVLFSGTPCQVEGLKKFLIKPYDNLLTIDILCHGVPSPMIFADYIKFIKKYSIGHLMDIFMKDKTFGWGYQDLRLYFHEGSTEFNSPISSLWNKIYYNHSVNRPSCHQCRFTNFNRAGDISIGDFWNIEKSYPDFFSNMGISLLMINTEKGERLWENVKSKFEYIESNIDECQQPVLLHPIPEPSNRHIFWEKYKKYGFEKVIRKQYNIKYSTLFKNQLHQIINIIRHK